MLDYARIRERKIREAEELGAVDIRNVRPSTRDFAYYVGTSREDVSILPDLLRCDPFGIRVPQSLDYESLVRDSEEIGALAFGVATDAELFGGSERDLALVARVAGVPVLRVDFIVRENQLFRSRLLGADSAILHASVLDAAEIARLLDIGRHMRMECAVEARDLDGIDRAVEAGARIISVDGGAPGTTLYPREDLDEMLDAVPESAILIVRGGIATVENLKAVRGKVDAVFIGTPFVTSPDPVEYLSVLIES
jgi:indole-3-glycerol phosphate synthase